MDVGAVIFACFVAWLIWRTVRDGGHHRRDVLADRDVREYWAAEHRARAERAAADQHSIRDHPDLAALDRELDDWY